MIVRHTGDDFKSVLPDLAEMDTSLDSTVAALACNKTSKH